MTRDREDAARRAETRRMLGPLPYTTPDFRKRAAAYKRARRRADREVGGTRCNRCHRPMPGTTAYDGACACGGLIEATPRGCETER